MGDLAFPPHCAFNWRGTSTPHIPLSSTHSPSSFLLHLVCRRLPYVATRVQFADSSESCRGAPQRPDPSVLPVSCSSRPKTCSMRGLRTPRGNKPLGPGGSLTLLMLTRRHPTVRLLYLFYPTHPHLLTAAGKFRRLRIKRNLRQRSPQDGPHCNTLCENHA